LAPDLRIVGRTELDRLGIDGSGDDLLSTLAHPFRAIMPNGDCAHARECSHSGTRSRSRSPGDGRDAATWARIRLCRWTGGVSST
jgi:hypothetical protein